MLPLQVPVVPSCLVRDSCVLSLVQTGWRFPLQGQVLPVGLCHLTSGNLLSSSSISPGRSLILAPSTFGGKGSVWWEWRQWHLCNSCTRIFQHGSQDASCPAQHRCPSVTPLLITRCVCMDLKPGSFHVPQLERLEKTFTSADTHTKEIPGIIIVIWLPLSSCMVLLFCVSFFFSRIKYLETLSRFGSYTYPRPTLFIAFRVTQHVYSVEGNETHYLH